MGNAVSAAELAASQIINPNEKVPDYREFDRNYYSSKDIPPECPLHRKQAPPPSECPIHASSKGTSTVHDDINPFNMVNLMRLSIFIKYYLFKNIKDASW